MTHVEAAPGDASAETATVGTAPETVPDLLDPTYPAQARADGIQGLVAVAASIARDGRVTGAKIVKSIPGLDQAALDAVGQFAFAPTPDKTQRALPLTVTIAFWLPR